MSQISLIKIADNLNDRQHQEVCAKILELGIDGIEISEFGGRWGAIWDANKNYNLNFLKYYKGIKALRIQLSATVDLTALAELSDSLEFLHIGACTHKYSQLDFLGRMANLKTLSTVKQFKGLHTITALNKLNKLYLTGYPVEKMDFLNELRNLKTLYLGFGTSTNINTINKLDNLEELELLWIKKLSNIDAISNLLGLRKLKIEDQKQIISLPDISKLQNFENLRVMNLSCLENISNIKDSYIKEFIWTGPTKNSEILNSIKNSYTPKKVYTYFHAKREQNKAERILGNKFCSLENMKFEMNSKELMCYYDVNTGQKVH